MINQPSNYKPYNGINPEPAVIASEHIGIGEVYMEWLENRLIRITVQGNRVITLTPEEFDQIKQFPTSV